MRSTLDTLLARAEAMSGDAEVVTRARLRRVNLPAGGGAMGLITLDNGHDHTRPNTLGPTSLVELNSAIDAALAEEEITSVGLTGKPFILAAGADLTAIGAAGPDGVRTIAELGHAVFRRLGEGGKPSFCFVNGLALGGGLEVALHCDFRTVLDTAAAVGLPEVMLGLVPGWGGSYLAPRLLGPDRAVTLILQNPLDSGRTLKGRQAHELGLADACFSGADFLEQSLRWAADVITGRTTVDRPDPAPEEEWTAAVARGRGIADAKTGGASPAAYRALDLIATARTSDRDQAFAAEDDALEALAHTPELLASLYAFDLVQKRAKRPAGAPDASLARPVTKVGIVGAGLMASQLALLFVRRLQVPVVLTDLDVDRVDRGVGWVHAELDKLLAKGRLTEGKARRYRGLVSGVVDPSGAFADADFVIEAVFEELAVKKQVFAELEKMVGADCVLASNTSSLSITEMAADLAHPERVVGFHFFNPVAVMPLLEIVRGEATDDATVATAFATGKALRKTTIGVRDSPSFIVNRLLGRMTSEVGRIVDAGTPVEVVDASFAGVTPMPPHVLLSLVGPAIALHNAESLAQAYPDRFTVSPSLRRVVESGLRSYYRPDGALDPAAAALAEQPAEPEMLTPGQVRDRVLAALADEARRMLDEQVVAAVEDLDLAMITGAGFLFVNGGLTMLLDRTGISERVTGRRFHSPTPA